MFLDAQQVETLQNSTPTDWSKFDQSVGADAHRFGQAPGGLPPGMGPGFDDNLHVQFFMKPRIDLEASARENRPIYKDVPHIVIMIPGDKNNIPMAEVWEQHIRRFPQHWAQFQAGIKDQVVGTPLKVAPFLTESHIAELAYFKVFTIEQLANLADSNLTWMGAREMKTAAQKYLQKVSGNEALMERIAALEAQLAEQGGKTPQHIAQRSERNEHLGLPDGYDAPQASRPAPPPKAKPKASIARRR